MIPGITPLFGTYHKIDDRLSHQQTIDDGSDEEEETALMSYELPTEGDSPRPPDAGFGGESRVSTDLFPIQSSKRRPSQVQSPSDNDDAHHDSLRSVSREGSIPINHPTPDLQAAKGAYVGNVERLEQHAERLSMSSDIGEEVRKLKQEQKRSESSRSSLFKPRSRQFSSTSQQNSILVLNTVARSGGYSTEGYVMSPPNHSPIRSPSWSHMSLGDQRHPGDSSTYSTEMVGEDEAMQSPASYRSCKLSVRNEDLGLEPHKEEQEQGGQSEYNKLYEAARDVVQRTASNASKTTFQQAEAEFAEFDGTHIHDTQPPIIEEEEEERYQLSPQPQGQPIPSRSSVQSPGALANGMVYYPAPVPVMLNLPPKLSKGMSAIQVAERRSKMLMADNKARRSAMNLLSEDSHGALEGASPDEPKLPPQLRATMYFNQMPVPQDLEVQGGSAIATLDSILDASASAPVTAFTDHPVVGQLGNDDVYGAVKRDSRKSRSMLNLSHETTRKSFLGFGRKSRLMDSEAVGDEDDKYEAEAAVLLNGDEIDENDTGRPTTLLAELQMRKKQQQSRNKTAANAFPGGMRATLLQMDAVAQVQRDIRKNKHVTLAWEPDAAGDDDVEDDEDVPLAMLQQRKGQGVSPGEEDRPLGLLAQRQLEDSEPLSARRARLRGEPSTSAGIASNQSRLNLRPVGGPAPVNDTSASENEENGDEAGETLAQRRRRLRIQQAIPHARTVSGDFASELMSQIGIPKEDTTRENRPSSPPPDDETLGQRRKRLQAERLKAQTSTQSAPQLQKEGAEKKRMSMANLLSSYPSGEVGDKVQGSLCKGPDPNLQQQSQKRSDPQHMRLQHSFTAPLYSPTSAPIPQLRPSPTAPLQQQASYFPQVLPNMPPQSQNVYYPSQQAQVPYFPSPLAGSTYLPPPSNQQQTSWAHSAGMGFGAVGGANGANYGANYRGAGHRAAAQGPQVYYPAPMPQGFEGTPVPVPLAHHLKASPEVAARAMSPTAGEDARRAMIDRWRQSVM